MPISLDDVLAVEAISPNSFFGPATASVVQRTYGGQVAAQALRAAQLTIDGKQVNSFHSYFLVGGDEKQGIVFDVEAIREGRSYVVRRVIGKQNGKEIYQMLVSFNSNTDAGPIHDAGMPAVTTPAESKPYNEARSDSTLRKKSDWNLWDIRVATSKKRQHSSVDNDCEPQGCQPYFAIDDGKPQQAVWFKYNGGAIESDALQQAALAYITDMTFLPTVMLGHAQHKVQMASLDHSVWFHRIPNVNDWILYQQCSPQAGAGRGFVQGALYSKDGHLLGHAVQQGLVRSLRS